MDDSESVETVLLDIANAFDDISNHVRCLKAARLRHPSLGHLPWVAANGSWDSAGQFTDSKRISSRPSTYFWRDSTTFPPGWSQLGRGLGCAVVLSRSFTRFPSPVVTTWRPLEHVTFFTCPCILACPVQDRSFCRKFSF